MIATGDSNLKTSCCFSFNTLLDIWNPPSLMCQLFVWSYFFSLEVVCMTSQMTLQLYKLAQRCVAENLCEGENNVLGCSQGLLSFPIL